MARVFIKRKGDFFLASSLFIGGSLLTNYPGIGFPKESELQYYTGKLDILKAVAGDSHSRSTNNHIAFYNKSTKTIHEFSCSYSALDSDYNGCGSDADFAPYIGKTVTVGWYQPDKLLGFTNKRGQMVTLQTRDKVIRSYKNTLALVKKEQKSSRYFIFFTFLLSLLLYWLFGKVAKKPIDINK